jgi:hypothetical protein
MSLRRSSITVSSIIEPPHRLHSIADFPLPLPGADTRRLSEQIKNFNDTLRRVSDIGMAEMIERDPRDPQR